MKKIFVFLLLLSIFPESVIGLNSVSTGYRITISDTKIDAHNVCRNVKSKNNKQFFIPTKSSAEWESVRNSGHPDLEFSTCTAECGLGLYNQQLETTITNANLPSGHVIFSGDVGISDDWLAFKSSASGGIYLNIYKNTGSSWQFDQRILTSDNRANTPGYPSGTSNILIDGNQIIVAYSQGNDANARNYVDIFNEISGNWVKSQSLNNPVATHLGRFGVDAHLIGNQLIIEGSEKTGTYSQEPRYYLYNKNGANYNYSSFTDYKIIGDKTQKVEFRPSGTQHFLFNGTQWTNPVSIAISEGYFEKFIKLNGDFMISSLYIPNYGVGSREYRIYKKLNNRQYALIFNGSDNPLYSVRNAAMSLRGNKLIFGAYSYSLSETLNGMNLDDNTSSTNNLPVGAVFGTDISDNFTADLRYNTDDSRFDVRIYRMSCKNPPAQTNVGYGCVHTTGIQSGSYSPGSVNSNAYYNGLGVEQGGFNTPATSTLRLNNVSVVPEGNYKINHLDPKYPLPLDQTVHGCFLFSNNNGSWVNVPLTENTPFDTSCFYRVKYGSYTGSGDIEINQWHLVTLKGKEQLFSPGEGTVFRSEKDKLIREYQQYPSYNLVREQTGTVNGIQKFCE